MTREFVAAEIFDFYAYSLKMAELLSCGGSELYNDKVTGEVRC